ncbi:MAG TPA: hypothetical protein EYN03_08980 [Planctomycetes bacterium]|nr:hypothetical protein [Planctomycetaceae bacterium]HIN95766.1 hypothetical protein [Planctomycetota bacterium]
MLQKFVVAVSVMCIWCLLIVPANGQSTNSFADSSLQGESVYTGVFLEPAIRMSVLEQSGLPLGLVPRVEFQSHLVDQPVAEGPVVTAAKADYSLVVAGENEKPKVAGKEKDGPLWFTSMTGLVMTRDRANDVELSSSTVAFSDPLLTTRDASMQWGGGFDIRFGRFFNDRQQAWEIVYWGLFADAEVADATDPDGSGTTAALNTPFQFNSLSYNGSSNPVLNLFNGAARHRLIRDYEFQNVEVNLWGNTHGWENARGLQVGWQAGIRFFRLRDSLEFMTDASDGVFTGAVDEVTYAMDTQNRLLGVQFGGLAQRGFKDRWNLNAAIKVGLFGNHITNNSTLGGSAGSAFVDDSGNPFDGNSYRLNTDKDDVAILGEIDLGVTYQIRERWRAFFGYRAVAIAGVGLSTNQFPTDFSNLTEAGVIHSNGSLILHGGYTGIELLY